MILRGDCVAVMQAIKPNSIDAVVCDPPYGLEFMGKEWDKLWDKRDKGNSPSQNKWSIQAGDQSGHKGFAGMLNNPNYKAGIDAQLWHTQWLTEAYRILKPGGSMLVMGGTRTFHRLACAIEDSGFVIKDILAWIYGSGFPKAQELSTLVDAKVLGISTKEVNERRKKGNLRTDGRGKWELKMNREKGDTGIGHADGSHQTYHETLPLTPEGEHWHGFKVGGIKPAYEPIIWAVKPPDGSYIDNVLKWGVGAVNVDACRVGPDVMVNKGMSAKQPDCAGTFRDDNWKPREVESISQGRFPANVILSHHPECEQVGMKQVKGDGAYPQKTKRKGVVGFGSPEELPNRIEMADPNGYETVESWQCHPDCAVRLLDEQSGVSQSNARKDKGGSHKYFGEMGDFKQGSWEIADSGGASRFYYCAKSSRSERNAGLEGMECKPNDFQRPSSGLNQDRPNREGRKPMQPKQNNHPTVKPISLMSWLIKLVTREGQIVLDPFLGSGTTAIAAHKCNRKCVGIEREAEYIEICRKRIQHWQSQPVQMEMRA